MMEGIGLTVISAVLSSRDKTAAGVRSPECGFADVVTMTCYGTTRHARTTMNIVAHVWRP